jgi:hypothetical protein
LQQPEQLVRLLFALGGELMRLMRSLTVVLSLLFATMSCAADWPPLSPEDLSMSSIQEQPGAPAVVLVREEIDDDMNNMHSVYMRIKILTEAGREYGSVQIPYRRRGFSIADISGRTVHRDGSIVGFEGKTLDKTVVKGNGIQVNEKFLNLPDVEVGSIIDFRYSLRYQDRLVVPPEWEVQNELFQRKAYFKFIPFQNHGNVEIQLDHNQIAKGIGWLPLLGKGSGPQMHTLPPHRFSSIHDVSFWVDLGMNDIPAFTQEPFMPPATLMKWRVYFYYQQNMTPENYWKSAGQFWNKDVESFVGKDSAVADALRKTVVPEETPEQKVHKIYAFVASLENQDYLPELTAEERKVRELKRNKGADDVLQHASGTHDDLNRLFVSMVRTAGIPASLILVPDREEQVFLKDLLTTSQFAAEIAIVQLGDKDVFLDPGTKFCPYGLLNWRYSGVAGLRQSRKSTEFGETPAPLYNQSVTTRMARVALDEHGILSGTISLLYKGTPAMLRRQSGGKTDAAGRKKLLEHDLEELLPGNSDVSLTNSPDWTNLEAPLVAQFHIACPYAVPAGKRLLVSQLLFQTGEKLRFPAVHRSNPVYFHVPWEEADEVHITLPAGMELESLAPDDSLKLSYALYEVRHKQEAPDKIFMRRDFVMGQSIFKAEEYQELKTFFDRVEKDDLEPALLRLNPSVATRK